MKAVAWFHSERFESGESAAEEDAGADGGNMTILKHVSAATNIVSIELVFLRKASACDRVELQALEIPQVRQVKVLICG